MSTIGGLLMPTFKPYDLGGTLEQANRIAGGVTNNQTALLTLADLKAKQASEQEYLMAIKNNPEIAKLLLGGSTIGSLPTTGGPPAGPAAPGPITQSPLGGGPAQQIPASPDASRFAGVPPTGGGPIPPNVMGQVMPTVTPPQSTIASLGQPQGQMQGPQNPLVEMARRDPRTALMLQQQIQGQQLNQLTMQEKHLEMGVKVSEAIARQLQGVTDQASMDEARERVRLIHPQAAAQIPQFYSKEAVTALQQRGVAMADQAKNRHYDAQSRKLDVESAMLPELYKRIRDEEEREAAGQPGGGGTAQVPAGGTAGTQARTAPPEFESAMDDANRLYPQVSKERIKSIIAAESNFDAKAVSSAGAKGPMQLMDTTAKEMGIDDPFNVQQNVRGGTRYYAQMLAKYGGDERKALAAYNWGPGNLDKVGGDVSKAPPETQAYVQRVLGGGGGGAAGTGTAQAAPTDPRIAQLEAKIARRTRDAQLWSAAGNESLSTRLDNDANRLTAEKNRLLEEARHQQERAEEIPRAVAKKTAETEEAQRLERQRQAGPMLPKDRRELLTGLRGDIRNEPTHKLFQDVRSGYQNVRIGADRDDAAGDLALISGLARIIDPGGTVHEGEFRNVEEAQGVLQKYLNTPQKFFEGDRLTPENRRKLLSLAHALAKEKLTTARTELTAVYAPLAKEGNIDMSQLLPLEDLKPIGPGPNVEKFDKILEKAK